MKIDWNNQKHCNRVVDIFAVVWTVAVLIYAWEDLF